MMETGPGTDTVEARLRRPKVDERAKLPWMLIIDDEPAVLDGLKLQLHRHVNVDAFTSAREALDAIRNRQYAVIMADMRMPSMDGASFLAEARKLDANCVRMMLTGNADLETAMAAVNEGHIFRFLTKPCPPHHLLASVNSAIHQYNLVTSERVLLSQTLAGCVRALTGVLAVSRPRAMGRALRARARVAALCARRGEEAWAVELAAMLSQVPAVTLPPDLEDRFDSGAELAPADQARIDRLPALAADLVAGIPRLEAVREILVHLANPSSSKAPWGAQALAAALDLDVLVRNRADARTMLNRLAERGHDPGLIEALTSIAEEEMAPPAVEIAARVEQLAAGMVLARDVMATNGALVAAAGHKITASLLEHLRGVSATGGIVEPVYLMPPDTNPWSATAG